MKVFSSWYLCVCVEVTEMGWGTLMLRVVYFFNRNFYEGSLREKAHSLGFLSPLGASPQHPCQYSPPIPRERGKCDLHGDFLGGGYAERGVRCQFKVSRFSVWAQITATWFWRSFCFILVCFHLPGRFLSVCLVNWALWSIPWYPHGIDHSMTQARV